MIIKNTIRQKIDSGEPTISTRFMSSEPDIAELIGDTGLFDYAEYYAEGSAVSMPSLYHIARAAQCGNLPLMVSSIRKARDFGRKRPLGQDFRPLISRIFDRPWILRHYIEHYDLTIPRRVA